VGDLIEIKNVDETFNFSKHFFSSTSEVRRKLSKEVFSKLSSENSYREIDSICSFGVREPRIPTCAEVKANSDVLCSSFFNRAALPLGLSVNQALPLDPKILSQEFLESVKSLMMKTKSRPRSGFPAPTEGLASSASPLHPKSEPTDKQACVFIWLKILEEIDGDRLR